MTESSPPRMAVASFRLTGDGLDLQARLPVPTGPARVSDLLPAARALSDQIVRETVKSVEASGATVSCRAGCASCCRGLVAISEVEARRLRDLVEAEPEPRRSERRARFDVVRGRLAEAGLLSKLREPARWTPADYNTLVNACFALALVCPFLEDESCSIYEERPIACREYLVTSPAERCAAPTPETIESVKLATKVWNALARAGTEPGRRFVRWVPLIVAPEWAAAHPDGSAKKPAPELLKSVFDQIAKSKAEPIDPAAG